MIDLSKRLAGAGINLSDTQIDKLYSYMRGVLEKNKSINLTSITDEDEFIDKHYIDSLLPVSLAEFQNAEKIIDVGTGGGFPGIPMAIAFPEKKFYLLDSLKKRLTVIDQLCAECGIENVTTVHMRAEDAAQDESYREQFDLCVSRAVAALNVLSELCIPFVKPSGHFLAYKGPGAADEIDSSKNAIRVTGGTLTGVIEFKSSDLNYNHNIVLIRKEKKTPSKYPRKAGTPSRKPIV